MRNSKLLALGVATLAMTLVMIRRNNRGSHAAVSSDQSQEYIRSAGPQEMADPPRKWNIVDETVDESFPASDPPATY